MTFISKYLFLMSTKLQIHENIIQKLHYFHEIHKIPNILFHGVSGCGKKTIVNDFINKIYDNNKEKIKAFTMYVNCAHGKGIKFIRDELKFFAKTHINSNGGNIFKSIILLNADKMTIDAQSALRRCIEIFSHNTRFFIIVENKYKLLKPILSRFCEIYIPEPVHNGKPINLYHYNIINTYNNKDIKKLRIEWLKKEIDIINKSNNLNIMKTAMKLYEKGYSGIDLIYCLENDIIPINEKRKYELLFTFQKVRSEIRNEKIFITFILNLTFVDTTCTLDDFSYL